MSRRMMRVPGVGRYLVPVGDEFVSVEALSGVVLVAATIAALVWVNVSSSTYADVWQHVVTLGPERWRISLDLRHWVNDGLMTLFFFVVGLEVKRELVAGDLRDRRTALVPVCAAFGGMIMPALIFVAINAGGGDLAGWATPIATDIALAVGVIALLGRRAPRPLRLFLLTLAVVDDIGAIVVIAFFYSEGIDLSWLAAALAAGLLIVLMRRFGISSEWWYIMPGVVLWGATYASGVHATIAGVVLGLLTPVGDVHGRDVLGSLEHHLHPWSSFAVVPLFALANAGVELHGSALHDVVTSRLGWGIAAGLLVGKTVGITGASAATVRFAHGRLPEGLRLGHIAAASVLAGIGFTVSLFVADLSFVGTDLEVAKAAVLCTSLVAACAGALVVARVGRQR